ncbi:MAG: hypothetical protein HWE11_16190 [Gammaproteobacteria bacterium]|nr:hypothetical protein [Gammaproteobacteria bacterium]
MKKLLNSSRYSVLSILFASASWIAQPASAASTQNKEEPRWFEIEVIVFKNNRANLTEELFPTQSAIEYPQNVVDQIIAQLYPAPEGYEIKPPVALLPTEQAAATGESTTSESTTSTQPVNEPIPFAPLTEQELQLASITSSLQRSSQYQALSHFGWRQPVFNKPEAKWVRVVGGKSYDDRFNHQGRLLSETKSLAQFGLNRPALIDNGESLTTSAESTTSATMITNSYTPVPEVDGAIQIYLSRYLHINTQVYLRMPGQEELDISAISASISSSLLDLTEGGQKSDDFENSFNWSFQTDSWLDQERQTTTVERLLNYPMTQSRRVRSGEVHYFDHPLFGVIIQIRPFALTEDSAQ